MPVELGRLGNFPPREIDLLRAHEELSRNLLQLQATCHRAIFWGGVLMLVSVAQAVVLVWALWRLFG